MLQNYILSFSENNYLSSIGQTNNSDVDIYEIDLDLYDLSGNRIFAHKWDEENSILVFDENKWEEIRAEQDEKERTQKETPSSLEETYAQNLYTGLKTETILDRYKPSLTNTYKSPLYDRIKRSYETHLYSSDNVYEFVTGGFLQEYEYVEIVGENKH